MNRSKFLAPILGVALVACGGGDAPASNPIATSASISGTATGLASGTVLLNNASAESIAVSANGAFSFSKRVQEGSAYNVTVVGEPNFAHCVVTGGTGTIVHDVTTVSNVSVACSEAAVAFTMFDLGVSVSGLSPGNSVTLMNNGTDTLTASEDGLYVFGSPYVTTALYSGRAGGYEVTVKTQPLNQSCTVSNGSGAVTPTAAVANNFVDVLVSCK